jgi:hypothetical protein
MIQLESVGAFAAIAETGPAKIRALTGMGVTWHEFVGEGYASTPESRRRAISIRGGAPNRRRYSRLNCEGLS